MASALPASFVTAIPLLPDGLPQGQLAGARVLPSPSGPPRPSYFQGHGSTAPAPGVQGPGQLLPSTQEI